MSLYYMENKTKKIEAIEIMKFFAALLITNSHFDIMYAKMPALATGGDCLKTHRSQNVS